MNATLHPWWYRRLQQSKHLAFIGLKRTRRVARSLRISAIDTMFRLRGTLTPFRFNPDEFRDEFVAGTEPDGVVAGCTVPRRMTVFWLGGTPMSANRSRALTSIRDLNPSAHVQLIDDERIESVLVGGHPLHPAYKHLALTHRSDYLRCYVMHFHGGGYCDVKQIRASWQPAFDRIESDFDAWALGYQELSHTTTTVLPGRIQDAVRRNFFRIVGNGAFIMRPRTPLTSEWFAEVNRRLDHWLPELIRHPGGIRGGEEPGEYPVPKHGILGDVLGPLALKYHEHLIIDESIRPDFTNYR